MTLEHPAVVAIQRACRKYGIWASPNIYLELDGKRYDASFMIDDRGKISGISKMVHITQAKVFYEQDYYTPSGKIGTVICFDRHLPDGKLLVKLTDEEVLFLADIPLEQIQAEHRQRSWLTL